MSAVSRSLRIGRLAAALALGLHGTADAATIAVNDAGSGSVAGKCTLSDAVAALNGRTAVNACAAGDGNLDTITLAAFTAPTTITFESATSADGLSAIGLTRDARVVGPLGSDGLPLVTIARSSAPGTAKFRVIGTTAYLALRGLAITGGDSTERGGGVAQLAHDLSYQYLHLVDSVVTGNKSDVSGGGVSFDCATTEITHSTVSGNTSQHNGGGIYSTSKGGPYPCYTTLSLQRSTVAGNSATGSGGGVFQFAGIFDLVASTLNSNSSGGQGGAIYGYGHLRMTNATITGNNAAVSAGAAFLLAGIVYAASSSITGNTCADPNAPGGVVSQTIQADASIFYGNSVADVQVQKPGATYQLSGSYNIIHNAPAPNSATHTLDCNPALGALANNGGETQTQSPGMGSCAIDAGPIEPPIDPVNEFKVQTDQRGSHYLRKSGSALDIGALETQPNERIFFGGFDQDGVFGMYFPDGLRPPPIIAGSGG